MRQDPLGVVRPRAAICNVRVRAGDLAVFGPQRAGKSPHSCEA